MTESELCKMLGKRIKEIREKKGMMQADLAAEINYDKSNMSRLESGGVNPRLYTLYRVALALDISISELTDFNEHSVGT